MKSFVLALLARDPIALLIVALALALIVIVALVIHARRIEREEAAEVARRRVAYRHRVNPVYLPIKARRRVTREEDPWTAGALERTS